MKRLLTLIFALTAFAHMAFAQCATTATVNDNEDRIFLIFETAAEATAYFTAAGGNNAPMTVAPGGAGTLKTTGNPLQLRILITTLPAGPFTGTITDDANGNACEFDGGTALPVSLTFFTAKRMEQSILLEWQTATELNNDYFAIEHSTNGRDFEPLEKVSGKGNSLDLINYTFEDKAPASVTNYYRLRQVDYDGTESFSNIVSIDFKDARLNLNLYPTSVREEINIDFTNFENENVEIEILNATGHLVLSKTVNGSEVFTLNLENLNLSQGMYFVQCRFASQIATGKFLIVK